MPAQDGVERDDEMELPQCPVRKAVEQGSEKCPVGQGKAGLGDLALQDG